MRLEEKSWVVFDALDSYFSDINIDENPWGKAVLLVGATFSNSPSVVMIYRPPEMPAMTEKLYSRQTPSTFSSVLHLRIPSSYF